MFSGISHNDNENGKISVHWTILFEAGSKISLTCWAHHALTSRNSKGLKRNLKQITSWDLSSRNGVSRPSNATVKGGHGQTQQEI